MEKRDATAEAEEEESGLEDEITGFDFEKDATGFAALEDEEVEE